jgi:NAD+ diphosphatase
MLVSSARAAKWQLWRADPRRLCSKHFLLHEFMLVSPARFDSAIYDVRTARNTIDLYFRKSELLVNETGDAFATIEHTIEASVALGGIDGAVYVAHRLPDDAAIDAIRGGAQRFAGLRSLFTSMPSSELAIALRGNQLLEWDRTHRFCGACGTETVRETNERARRCPSCGLSAYPRISPAMMCLVTRGKEILLARNANFPPGRYSALAGFLEAGESIEDAVHREVREEVGVEVKNLRYFASQSWPFPNSLMIAFTAEYAGGELKPNGHEIVEADWFLPGNLPQLPPSVSIARALIDGTLTSLHSDYSPNGQHTWGSVR